MLCCRRSCCCCTGRIIQCCIYWICCRRAQGAVAWWRIFWWMWKCWIEVWKWWSWWYVWRIVNEHALIVLLMWCDWSWCSRISLISLIWIIRLIWRISCRTGCRRFRTQFPLSNETLQMWHETKSQWILDVHALDRHQISRYLRSTFTESNDVIIHSKSLRVKSINWIDSWDDKINKLKN